MEANFWEAGSMRSDMDTRISTSVRPNSGSNWFNWADAWEEEVEEEEEEKDKEEEKEAVMKVAEMKELSLIHI